MNPEYTDRFGQIIREGDRVVSLYGGTLLETPILKLIPLVPHRDYPQEFMRSDQAKKAHPTIFSKRHYPTPDKQYVVMGQRNSWGTTEDGSYGPVKRRYAFTQPSSIIRVPDGS